MNAPLDQILDTLVLPGFSKIGYKLRASQFKPLSENLQGKTFLVTGATSGIGKAMALGLGQMGAHVVAVGRNQDRGQALVTHLQKTSGSGEFLQADLSDLSQTKNVFQKWLKGRGPIDGLINNAGVLLPSRQEIQGLEASFVTNVLSGFLLTHLCWDHLKNGRVLFVSSGGAYASGLNTGDLQWKQRKFDGVRAYAETKRAQIVLASLMSRLAEKQGPLVMSMHPGWADTPGVETSLPGFYKVMKPLLRTAEEGADTAVWLMADPTLSQHHSGKFFCDREPRPIYKSFAEKVTWQQTQDLWQCCETLCGVNWPVPWESLIPKGNGQHVFE